LIIFLPCSSTEEGVSSFKLKKYLDTFVGRVDAQFVFRGFLELSKSWNLSDDHVREIFD
jgi:hypothetical protein